MRLHYPFRPWISALFLAGLVLILSSTAWAATAKEIDTAVDETLHKFYRIKGGEPLVQSAKGVLVFPRVIQAGLLVGGQFGEGALRVGHTTVDYYRTAAASIGFQAGAQGKSVIILFMTREALDKFRASSGWQVGVDGSIAMITLGTAGSIDTLTTKSPIVGIVFDQQGLMANLTLEGSKFTRIDMNK